MDDKRTPISGDWNIVRSYHDFIFMIEQSFDKIKMISFDYRLDNETSFEKTGLDCAKYLIEYCAKNDKHIPKTIVHDTEISGVEKIVQLINGYLLHNGSFPNSRWFYVENY